VLIDNAASEGATVIEVRAHDALGLLYRVTSSMAELDLDIRSARVQTLGDHVVDAFYVRDSSGSKLVDPKHLDEVERALLHALGD
jgi:[protein-PII] uridylyltransferase